MRVKITDRCKVWEINDKEGMAISLPFISS